jgi:hypothetical protein
MRLPTFAMMLALNACDVPAENEESPFASDADTADTAADQGFDEVDASTARVATINTCYVDFDRDGARTTVTVQTTDACSKSYGYAKATAAVDCNDTNGSMYPGATEKVGDQIDQNCDGGELCYVDSDKDGYRTTTTIPSADLTCAAANGEAMYNVGTDCYDRNAAAHPGQLGLYSVDRGDGSFDYNCDGTTLLAYNNTDTFSCGVHDGWLSARPACGKSADYGSYWTGTGASCAVYETINYTQVCR